MKIPSPKQFDPFRSALLVSLEENQGQSDSVGKIPRSIPPEYGEWALMTMEGLQKRYMEIEEAASRDLNLIYREELGDTGKTDRHTPAIMALLDKCEYPDITEAMLHLRTYEPMIWKEVARII